MPKQKAHINQCRHNEEAIKFLSGRIDDFPDWVAVVAFYKALHAIETVFAAEGKHYSKHTERNSAIRKHPKLKGIWNNYRLIKSASRIARYLTEDEGASVFPCFAGYMTPEQVKTTLLEGHLVTVETAARAAMPAKAPSPPSKS